MFICVDADPDVIEGEIDFIFKASMPLVYKVWGEGQQVILGWFPVSLIRALLCEFYAIDFLGWRVVCS